MPKTLSISVNLGSDNTGLFLAAQIIKSNGTEVTSAITDGFYEVGNGFYVWEYSNFPENFRGGVKFFDSSDNSLVLMFSSVSTEEESNTSDEVSVAISQTFDITYSDQSGNDFYALLFSAQDLTKAWNPFNNTFETYTLATHSSFVMDLEEDAERLGLYLYSIPNTSNIPAVIGNEYYFIEIWNKIGENANRTTDRNTGNLRVYWGRAESEALDIARKVWEYGTRTLTDFNGITPQQIWEYATRTLTSLDYEDLEASILAAIEQSTNLTKEEIIKGDTALSLSIQQTFELLETCCAKTQGTPLVQTPRIGAKGSSSNKSDVRFS